MIQTPLLALGTSAGTSLVISVDAGKLVSVGIYSAADADLPTGVNFKVYRVTPGALNFIDRMNNSDRDMVLSGPAEYVVKREAYSGTAFGVFSNS